MADHWYAVPTIWAGISFRAVLSDRGSIDARYPCDWGRFTNASNRKLFRELWWWKFEESACLINVVYWDFELWRGSRAMIESQMNVCVEFWGLDSRRPHYQCYRLFNYFSLASAVAFSSSLPTSSSNVYPGIAEPTIHNSCPIAAA